MKKPMRGRPESTSLLSKSAESRAGGRVVPSGDWVAGLPSQVGMVFAVSSELG